MAPLIAAKRGVIIHPRRAENLIIPEERFGRNTLNSGLRPGVLDSRGNHRNGRAVPDMVARAVIVGSGIGGVRIAIEGHITPRHDHFTVGEIRVAEREAGGRSQCRIDEAWMILVDAGIDDADLDAGPGIGRAAQGAPRVGDIFQAQCLIELPLEARQRHYVDHPGDREQLRRRLAGSGHKDGVQK